MYDKVNSNIDLGSGNLPVPFSPHAISPVSGSINFMPLSNSFL